MYRCGLGGAEKRKYAHHSSHKQILKGPRKPRVCQRKFANQRAGALLGSLWGHFGIILGYKRRMADVMRIGAGLLGLKSENMHAIVATSRFLRGQGSHEYARESLRMSEPRVILGSLWSHFAHFGITLGI